MNLSLIALAIFAVAVMVVGLIEWIKGWWKKIPGWFPSVASPVLCLALGQVVAPLVLLGTLAWVWGVVLGLLGLAVTELCYKVIVQSIPQIVSGAIQKVVPASVQPGAPPPDRQPVAPPPPSPAP